MPLTQIEARDRLHPVDVVEHLAAGNGWAFEREQDDEICISVTGGWTDYHLAFTWLAGIEALHVGCAFDVKAPERRRMELLNLVSLVNEQLWVGHFGLWDKESMIIFRHSILLPGGAQPSASQCEAVIQTAIGACERYYQAFQFVLWAGRSAREALEAAMFETAGEA
jgi:hypothetical protein